MRSILTSVCPCFVASFISLFILVGPVGPRVIELDASQGQVSNSLLSRIDYKDECVDNCLIIVLWWLLWLTLPLTQPRLLCARHICRARQPNG
jgi:hypothetical protein